MYSVCRVCVCVFFGEKRTFLWPKRHDCACVDQQVTPVGGITDERARRLAHQRKASSLSLLVGCLPFEEIRRACRANGDMGCRFGCVTLLFGVGYARCRPWPVPKQAGFRMVWQGKNGTGWLNRDERPTPPHNVDPTWCIRQNRIDTATHRVNVGRMGIARPLYQVECRRTLGVGLRPPSPLSPFVVPSVLREFSPSMSRTKTNRLMTFTA